MRHTEDESAANSSGPEFREFLQNAGRRSFLGGLAAFLLVAGQACPCAGGGGAIGRVAQLSGKWRENSRRLWSRRDLARNSCRQSTRSEGPRAYARDRDAFPRADRKQYGEWKNGRP